MAFGCGIDSFVCDLIERKIRKDSKIPFIVLNIDEHSGEAGMNTRLEAFIDMIRWRNKNEDNVSAYGNTYIVAKSLLDDLGIDYQIPPFNNKRLWK